MGRRTDSYSEGYFEDYISQSSLVRRTAYTATKRISKATGGGSGKILWPTKMNELYENNKDALEFKGSVGYSLNMAVNEVADVLHTFWLNEVK